MQVLNIEEFQRGRNIEVSGIDNYLSDIRIEVNESSAEMCLTEDS